MRELLRYRPPVIMVPYEVKKPFPITNTYTIPKGKKLPNAVLESEPPKWHTLDRKLTAIPRSGAMVVPTTYLALRDPEVYEEPDEFDPERYYTGDAEVKGAKNFLVFGTGPHVCIGQHYAQLNLALMLGKASLLLDWTHHPTPLSEEIKVFATIFPKVSWSHRRGHSC